MDDKDKHKLNRLEGKLYSRKSPQIIDPGRSEFDNTGKFDDLKTEWQPEKQSKFDMLAYSLSQKANKKGNFVKKFFTFALITFLVSGAFATFIFFGGINMISSENVDIKVVGPVSVGGGQEVELDIKILNNNNTALDSVSLLVEYPSGTRSKIDLSKDLQREKFQIEKIIAGGEYSQTIKPVFFGERESVKKIKFSIEYRVEKSSATFFKEKIHEISISSSPVIISSTYPKEVNSNQEMLFEIELTSNSQDPINDLLLKVEYPFGFVFKDSKPSSVSGGNLWNLSTLKPGEKKKVSIRGLILGQDGEEKVFKINSGTASKDDSGAIEVNIVESLESIMVKKPFIDLYAEVGGGTFGDVYFAEGGDNINTKLFVRNNLNSKIFKNVVEVSFSGGAFDQLSVYSSDNGFFRSSDNTIIWDYNSLPKFEYLDPGEEGELSFKFTPKKYGFIPIGGKPEVILTMKIKGERVLDSGSVEKIENIVTKKVILNTDVGITTKVFRSLGDFENSGPVPPKVNNPTTYTLLLEISNSFNQINNTEVRTKLPPYVKWTGLYGPSAEIVTFNQITNELLWNAGSVQANTGFGSNAKKVYIQLEFTPSTSQIGETPELTEGFVLSGKDKVTGASVSANQPPVTINFAGDPIFKPSDDEVVP